MTARTRPAPMTGLVKAKIKDGTEARPAPPPTGDHAVALNFTVPRSFRRRFKRLALELDISQVELLKRALALLEREHDT